MPETERRLTDLEIHVAHQEQTIAELSEAIRLQWAELDSLRARVSALITELRADLNRGRDDTGDPPPADQRPPHW